MRIIARHACLLILFAILASTPVKADGHGEAAHIAVENPAELSPADAEKIYAGLKQSMAENYALSRMDLVDNYLSWKRYNSAPYLSATHGQRFVSNYANDAGSAYGALKDGERYPVGTVLAKDSITVTDEGKTFPGALFVMEKLAAGASPDTADWRYVMIIPDGSLYGDTQGDETEQVQYCHSCHKAKAKQDFVFFIPDAFRSNP